MKATVRLRRTSRRVLLLVCVGLPILIIVRAMTRSSLTGHSEREPVHRPAPAFSDAYARVYAEMMMLPEAARRYVIYEWNEGDAGWGNRLEASLNAFSLAIADRRILVFKHQTFHRMFDNPIPGTDWRYEAHASAIERIPPERRIVTHFPPRNALMNTNDYKQVLHDHDLISVYFGDGDTKFLSELFEQGLLRANLPHTRAGELASWMLSRPTEALLAACRSVGSRIGLSPAKPLATIQLRAFVDLPQWHDEFMKAEQQRAMWGHIRRSLARAGVRRDTHDIFVTTDDPALWDVAVRELSPNLGAVRFHDVATEHSSFLKDQDGIPSSLAEWFIMSQSKIIICTMTSYCQSAAKRNAFQAQVYYLQFCYDPRFPTVVRRMSPE
ncbi:unnamed protein product (mitochondrion) [Plasmodiophora brassicae]|uniref:GT23 domain-containing protein n=2 Tax=Plasmodiophora brassicae TaxID=37360 RepID=A0A3P3YHT3_PLABS|nr:unnamed protein product [Plasmodiophora brassicae]